MRPESEAVRAPFHELAVGGLGALPPLFSVKRDLVKGAALRDDDQRVVGRAKANDRPAAAAADQVRGRQG